MPSLILYNKRTIIGGDDIQPTMIVSMVVRMLQIVLFCIPILYYTIHHIVAYVIDRQDDDVDMYGDTTGSNHYNVPNQRHQYSAATPAATTTVTAIVQRFLQLQLQMQLQRISSSTTTTTTPCDDDYIAAMNYALYNTITIWCIGTILYNTMVFVLEYYLLQYSNIGTPTTQIHQRTYYIQYILSIKLGPCTVLLFCLVIIPIYGLLAYSIIPHYRYHHMHHQYDQSNCTNHTFVYDNNQYMPDTYDAAASIMYNSFERHYHYYYDDTVSHTEPIIRTRVWYSAIFLLFLTQCIELFVSVLFSYQLYQLPSIVDQQQQQPSSSSSSSSSHPIPALRRNSSSIAIEDGGTSVDYHHQQEQHYHHSHNYNHELVEEMWAKRCVSICRCLSISTCFLFGGRNFIATNGTTTTTTTTSSSIGGMIDRSNSNTGGESTTASTTSPISHMIFVDVARAISDFLESHGVLDIVGSDIVTGLLLVQRIQRQRIYLARQQYYTTTTAAAVATMTHRPFFCQDTNSNGTISNMIIDRVESGILLDNNSEPLTQEQLQQQQQQPIDILSSVTMPVPVVATTTVTTTTTIADGASTLHQPQTTTTTTTIRKRSSTKNLMKSSATTEQYALQSSDDDDIDCSNKTDSSGLIPITKISRSRNRTKSIDRTLVLPSSSSLDDITLCSSTATPILFTPTDSVLNRSRLRNKNEYNAVLQYPNTYSRNNTANDDPQLQEQEQQSHSYYRINANVGGVGSVCGGYHREVRSILNRYDPTEVYLLDEMARYAKYALAIYTWILYLYEHPISGPFRLLLQNGSNWCHCCCRGATSRSRGMTSLSSSPSTEHLQQQQQQPYTLHESPLPSAPTNSPFANTDDEGRFEGDNICRTHKNAILLTVGLQEADIVYLQLRSSLSDIPYCILLDHAWKSVVVSIRGTFSIEDCITDVLITPESVEQLGINFGFDVTDEYCHGGVLSCARTVYRDLEQHGILDKLLLTDDAIYPGYTLRIVGHSLGAATSTLLSYMLKQKFPTLRCINYSPPGCSFTWKMATQCKDWCTTCVLDSDLVPRLTIDSIERLRDEILELIGRIKVPKSVVAQRFTENTFRICNDDYDKDGVFNYDFSDILYDPADVPDTEYKQQLVRFKEIQEERRRHRGTVRSTPLYPPGRILHLVKTGEKRSYMAGLAKVATCCTTNIGSTYIPVWVQNDDFDEILVGPRMGTDHFPNRIRAILERVAKDYEQ